VRYTVDVERRVDAEGSCEPGRGRLSDPLEKLIALVEDDEGPDDVAVHHDHYLYRAPKEPKWRGPLRC
jgi:hypothetical protein